MEKPGHAIAFLPGKHEGTVIPLEAEKDDLQLSTSMTRRRKVQPELGGLLLYWFRWSHGYLYLRDWHLATLWKERESSESLCMPLATALTGESLTKSPTLPAGPQRICTFYTQLFQLLRLLANVPCCISKQCTRSLFSKAGDCSAPQLSLYLWDEFPRVLEKNRLKIWHWVEPCDGWDCHSAHFIHML